MTEQKECKHDDRHEVFDAEVTKICVECEIERVISSLKKELRKYTSHDGFEVIIRIPYDEYNHIFGVEKKNELEKRK